MAKAIYIVSGSRTPIGSFQGMFKDVSAVDLGVAVVRESISRAGIDSLLEKVDEVNMGCIYQHGQGQGVARQIALNSGIPKTVPAVTTNLLCGSGLFSVIQSLRAILAGDANLCVAGGTENMTRAPFLLTRAREGYRMGHGQVFDSLLQDGLTDVFNDYHMGMTAENLAEKYAISRAQQDEYALLSQHRAQKAIETGKFCEEIVSVNVEKRGKSTIYEQDEYPRMNCKLETLQRLKAAFKPDGTVTAGNASGINDGAAAVVVADEESVSKLGSEPLARITGWGVSGCDPAIMGIGPVEAVRKALARSGTSLDEIDLIEANEAFAAQTLAVSKELGWDQEKVNVNGGAIALGHPVGASGARILITLLYEMKRRGVKRGIATLCVGGGMGVALQVERD
jgi:acetyl-CoA C-acetyltransferase